MPNAVVTETLVKSGVLVIQDRQINQALKADSTVKPSKKDNPNEPK